MLAITHYARLLTELRPDRIHVLRDGRVVASGGPELADQLEKSGYEGFGIPTATRSTPAEPDEREEAPGSALAEPGASVRLRATRRCPACWTARSWSCPRP